MLPLSNDNTLINLYENIKNKDPSKLLLRSDNKGNISIVEKWSLSTILHAIFHPFSYKKCYDLQHNLTHLKPLFENAPAQDQEKLQLLATKITAIVTHATRPGSQKAPLADSLQKIAANLGAIRTVAAKINIGNDFDIESGKGTERVVLKHKNSNATLTLAKGDLTQQHGQNVEAVMNAANAVMFHGGSGTNAALSNLVPKAHWKKEAHNLSVTECGAMTWPDKPLKNDPNQIKPRYILHVLGPDISKIKNPDMAACKKLVYEAYTNLFNKCKELGLGSIQVTGLSTGAFAGPFQGNQEWYDSVDQALYQAMTEAMQQGKVNQIVYVAPNRVPLSNYL